MRIWDEEMETLDPQGLERIQLERLAATIERVWKAGTPYRRKMDEAGLIPADLKGRGDLEKFPFSVKTDFKDNYPLGMLAVPLDEAVRLHASSGTTGSRTVVYYTAKDIDTWAELIARMATAAGVVPTDAAQVSFTYGLFTGGFGLHYGLERIGALVIPASGGNTDLQFSLMKDMKTTVLVSTPTYALYLAEAAREKGIDLTAGSLRVGLFGSEPWGEGVRVRIEEGLGLSATDNYGLSEVFGPGVSGECERKDGMHVAEDHFFIEVIDPATGDRLPDGEQGELVITTLTREAMPVIRFRTGDLSAITREPCGCGRTSARMSKVLGRTDDMLIIRGVNVYPSQIEKALLEVDGVEPHFAVVVDRDAVLDRLEVWVEVSEAVFSDDTRDMNAFRNKVESHLKSALNVRAEVSLKEPRTLERTPGKAKRVLDRREL